MALRNDAHCSRRLLPSALVIDRSRSFDRSTLSGPSPRRQDAELIAVWIGEDDPRNVSLTDVDARCTMCQEAVDLGLMIFVGRRRSRINGSPDDGS